ncbi:S-4TM family putative pore-forming effector [Scleromatobacter humisilvae]|uniref:S-4TM family putative pore-forming effector n=1 Tax=Scleromatobacter humisilvae TaxID=2897159 RepID=A0A9X1YIZ4_9BURK|nr:S-4TM family putative pore-forming effector [Scleromatobacter humisilvae]MCK9685720.1 S-4TM family putative pore-forming effector [Scleromatobacter humisilvae]
MNDIPVQQAKPERIRFLRARDRNYRFAKWTQGVMVSISIALPVFGAIEGPTHPTVKAFVALAAIILLLLDTGWIERVQKDRIKRGAKLQELFDTEVFSLQWNRFVAGKPVDLEELRRLSAKPLDPERESHFLAWYDASVAKLPLYLGRMVCQRTNLRYDSRVRRTYGSWVLGATVVFAIAMLAISVPIGLQLNDLLLNVAVPFMPLLTWALKEHRAQTNSATSIDNLFAEWDTLWDRALRGGSIAEMEAGSRNLQDAIYQYRERNPLVFDWVYYRMRDASEDEAHHAAEELVATAMKSLEGRAQQ